jgi:hypothetical protein
LRGLAGCGVDDFFAPGFEMKRNAWKSWLLWAVVTLGFAVLWMLQQSIDLRRGVLHEEQDDLVLQSGALLKAMSLEYAPLLADIYWTRVVQYYGGKKAQKDVNIDLLWPLLDITTTLDPHLVVAYRFGATFLSQPVPTGAGRPDLGIALIERGIRENPDYWRFYEDLGFIYYFDLKDYKRAAQAFRDGSEKPGAMIWMKTFAARIAAEGGTRETSAQLWSEVYDSATDANIKSNALLHLKLLKAEIDCEKLDVLAAEYYKRFGRRPIEMRELAEARLIQGLPADPDGYIYTFNAEGKAALNPGSPLFKANARAQR